MDRLLRIENLSIQIRKEAKSFEAVRDISFEIGVGETVALVGESGSGKTLSSLACLRLLPEPQVQISAGKILYRDQDLMKFPEKEMRKIRGNRISMVFQDPMSALNPYLTIERQLTEVLEIHQGRSREDARRMSIEALQTVGIPEPEKRIFSYPHQLSGGQRQRVLIAMALLCEPELLIADEPTTALDVTVQSQILALLKQLKLKRKMSLLLITHDLGVVAGLADRIVVLYAGRIMEQGTCEEVFKHPKHPYTKGLIASIPSVNTQSKLQSIRGNVPELQDLGKGCPFDNRCDYAIPRCSLEFPPAKRISPQHESYCFEADKL